MAGSKRKSKTKIKSGIVERGKRKESTARASICAGKGILRINSLNIDAISNRYVKELLCEPLRIAGDVASKADISVTVHGGGEMGQAQAARLAIARALVKFSSDPALRERMAKRDKFLVAEDSRRVEPKKFKGPKARARFQKSYR